MYSPSANASIIYSLVTDQTTYTAAANASVTVNVYLKETLSGTSTSLITADGGLFGGGFEVTAVSGSDTLTGSSADTALFGGPVTYKSSNSTTQQAVIEGVSNSATAGVPVTNGEILLGTVTVKAGASGNTTYAVTSYNGPTSTQVNTTFTTGYNLDKNHTGNGTTGNATFTGIDTSNPSLTAVDFTVSTPAAGPTVPTVTLTAGTTAPTDGSTSSGTGTVNLSSNPFVGSTGPFTPTTEDYFTITGFKGGDLRILLDLTATGSALTTEQAYIQANTSATVSPGNAFVPGFNTVLDYGNEAAGSYTFEIALPSTPTAYTFDNAGAIPEPASLGLLAVGAVGILARRRK
jgi:hypothetical protein